MFSNKYKRSDITPLMQCTILDMAYYSQTVQDLLRQTPAFADRFWTPWSIALSHDLCYVVKTYSVLEKGFMRSFIFFVAASLPCIEPMAASAIQARDTSFHPSGYDRASRSQKLRYYRQDRPGLPAGGNACGKKTARQACRRDRGVCILETAGG